MCIRRFLIVAFIICSGSLFGQVQFEQGYFINRDGQRTEGQLLLRREDWRDNPKAFDFRANESAEARPADLESVTELGLSTGEVFKRLSLYMDRSSDEVAKLKEGRNPEFKNETLFLRLLVSGKATLYQYDEGNLHRFFFAIDNGEIKQLVYKRYMTPNYRVNRLDPNYGTLDVAVNEDYKQQLLNELKCKDIQKKDFEALSYDTEKLKRVFIRYNECQGGATVSYEKKARKGWPVRLSARIGLAMNGVNIKNISMGGGGTANIESTTGPRLGFEMEAILPFGEGNWSVPIEATYQSFSGQIPSGSVKVAYSSFDFLLGLRRGIPVSESTRLYFTGSVWVNVSQSTTINIVTNTYGAAPSPGATLAVGLRVRRFSAEFLYMLPRNLMPGSATYEAKMSSFAFNLGYAFSM